VLIGVPTVSNITVGTIKFTIQNVFFMKLNIQIVTTSLFIFFCISCKSDRLTEPSFTNYIERFIGEGKKRGIADDLLKTKVTINFGIVNNGGAASANFLSKTITVDKDSWNIELTDEALDLYREQLIFHELGHYILKREHVSDILESSEYASMMLPSPLSGVHYNYRGKRRAYYIDELFNDKIAQPYWSKTKSFKDLISESGRTLAVSEDFDTKTNMLPDSNIYSYKNGSLFISTKNIKSRQEVVSQKLLDEIGKIPASDSYEFEMKIKFTENGGGVNVYPNGERKINNLPSDRLSFYYTTNNNLTITSSDFFLSRKVTLFDDKFHIIKIRKWKDDIYCFIDGELIGIWDIWPTNNTTTLQVYGKSVNWYLAYIVPQNSVSEMDYMRLYKFQ
jgi:hypothetical protein